RRQIVERTSLPHRASHRLLLVDHRNDDDVRKERDPAKRRNHVEGFERSRSRYQHQLAPWLLGDRRLGNRPDRSKAAAAGTQNHPLRRKRPQKCRSERSSPLDAMALVNTPAERRRHPPILKLADVKAQQALIARPIERRRRAVASSWEAAEPQRTVLA